MWHDPRAHSDFERVADLVSEEDAKRGEHWRSEYLEGRLVAPPSRAEEMDHPETFGRGAGMVVVVE